MSDWKEYTLEELCDFQNGFAFKNSDYVDSSENTNEVFRMGYINRGGGFKEDTTPVFVPKNYPKNLDKFILKPNDITIAMTDMKNSMALLGYCAIISHNNRFILNQRVGRIRVVRNDILDPIYLYYYLNSSKQIDYLRANANSGVQVNLGTDTIKKSILKIPSIEKQREIANILFALDQKIELNTQINQTLEQIAQALFKSWFVDFDPVRAKVQALSDGLSLEQAELAAMQAISGRTPEELTALSQTQPERYAELAEIAKAFPCEMVEVDGVEVPKGWKIGTFTDITESRREKVKNDKATVLSAVSSGELVKSEEYFTKQVFSKSIDKYLKVYQWDFAYNPARINIGSIGLHEAAYLGAVSPVYEVFSVSDKYHWFLKRILNLETTKIKIQSLCTGSVRQTLKLKDFQSIDCVIPDEKTLSIFNKKWEEYRTLILENNKNTQTLSEIRDLLLPRLLSGEFND